MHQPPQSSLQVWQLVSTTNGMSTFSDSHKDLSGTNVQTNKSTTHILLWLPCYFVFPFGAGNGNDIGVLL
jgi:hypothetical protein